ncbi:hypothetical protein EYF80_034903 [Liparis tanakae]|uniref:Uncharacterized protein n=1 Tax=Liparis tanakae TaxID=230148 RepID=A0A4Z2GQ25_9TELE|nr:hypothetical protein EYF80_034903 [Liparis tanakae]
MNYSILDRHSSCLRRAERTVALTGLFRRGFVTGRGSGAEEQDSIVHKLVLLSEAVATRERRRNQEERRRNQEERRRNQEERRRNQEERRRNQEEQRRNQEKKPGGVEEEPGGAEEEPGGAEEEPGEIKL